MKGADLYHNELTDEMVEALVAAQEKLDDKPLPRDYKPTEVYFWLGAEAE